MKTICEDLDIICHENDLFRCEGRLKNVPLPYQAKAPRLINSEHYLATLIVNDIHTRFKHISIKKTLAELRQNFWIWRGKQFARNIIRKCVICKTLLCEVNLFTKFLESLRYYFIAYCCNFLHKYPHKFLLHPRILIVTLMNRNKVLLELSLHWQSLTSID